MPVVLRNPATHPFDNVADLGIAIRLFRRDETTWQHVGVLYKDGDKPARVFHLADHFDSRDEVPDQNWRWVQADLPLVNRRLVVELTKKIVARKDKLQF